MKKSVAVALSDIFKFFRIADLAPRSARAKLRPNLPHAPKRERQLDWRSA